MTDAVGPFTRSKPKRTVGAYAWLLTKMAVFMALFGGGLWYVGDRYQFAFDQQQNKSLFVSKFLIDTYVRPTVQDLSYGEIVVFALPDEHWPDIAPWPKDMVFMKRVVGLPGDSVRIGEHVTSVNDQGVAIGLDLSEKLSRDPADFRRVYTVQPNHFLPMGDSLDSYDGRYYGPLHEDNIRGRVVLSW